MSLKKFIAYILISLFSLINSASVALAAGDPSKAQSDSSSISFNKSSQKYDFKFKVNYIGAYMTCERANLNGKKAIGAEFALDSQISGYLYCLFPDNKKGAKTTFVCAKTLVKGRPVTMTFRPRNSLSQFVDCLTP